MNLYEALNSIETTEQHQAVIPSYLYGAFRRKSISFYNGLTDENTIVYWFQSRSFTIDLRLKHPTETPVVERQGWIGDTRWDTQTELLSWHVKDHANYQNHVQWPEPAKLHAIGNCILEFSPSNVYVEDWRQQVQHGLFLGLRLKRALDLTSQQFLDLDGGLIICDNHFAFSLTRLPHDQDQVQQLDLNSNALTDEDLTAIESFEVSVRFDGIKRLSTTHIEAQSNFNLEGFKVLDAHHLLQQIEWYGRSIELTFEVDMYIPAYSFQHSTETTQDAQAWFTQQKDHLAHHAEIVL
ncbi:hypothetical protein [Acinetobacter shaoyimingii]|uniref:Uncharacterized protein n=1 Tax=Acinetobacter shaoyimingii TaxID=2715164 RepID=A0A6G8RVE8_9GAMM|nr:hypothetical protein [Acinetobacter shaoyimingii]QIO05894.1 hypothetical protein G8E00_08000 [Acinetobacter shaoyimingii]